MWRRCAPVVAALLWAPSALAQSPSPATSAAEITALEAQINRSLLQLSTGCAVACPALASMERAADRICALDPGPRCASARAKVRDAAQRVEQACGPCRDAKPAVPKDKDTLEKAANKPEAPPREPATPAPAPTQTKSADEPQGGASLPPQPPAPPPPAPTSEAVSAPRHGGCAACAVTGSGDETLGGGLLAALAVAVGVTRRRSRRR